MEQTGMTKFLRMLGAAAVTVVAGSLLLGASGAFAQSPPSPPSRFVGTVTVNGQPAKTGAVVTAQVNGNACGSGNVGDASAGGANRYKIDVPAADPAASVQCGKDGDTVTFFVDGVKANETGTWHNYELGQVNLTVTSSTSTATATPSTTGTPSSTSTAKPSATPKGPNTGSGVAGGSSSAPAWLFALLGMGAVAFGIGGVAAAKRRN
jgi:hypothetical protein